MEIIESVGTSGVVNPRAYMQGGHEFDRKLRRPVWWFCLVAAFRRLLSH